ncbi:MAG: pyruvoyl-dependent arginine decarboxylase [Candidatus Marsarchaeota archaeon]
MIAKKFFVTSGKAVDPISSLNAFDAALVDAKISQCNLVSVSSILPPEAEEVQRVAIHPGSVTFVVMARMDGDEGEEIAAGVAWTWEANHKFGMVAEAHGYMSREAITEILEWKLSEMARLRGIAITEKKIRAETLTVPMDNYGSVVSALVFVPSAMDYSQPSQGA